MLFNIYYFPEHDAGEHVAWLVAEAISTHLLSHLGSQFAGSQFLGSQHLGSHLSALHSVFAFCFAFFLPPLSFAAKAEPDIRAITSKLKNTFFIFKN
jgi:hypothetical protein